MERILKQTHTFPDNKSVEVEANPVKEEIYERHKRKSEKFIVQICSTVFQLQLNLSTFVFAIISHWNG